MTIKNIANPLILHAANAYLRKRLQTQVIPLNKDTNLNVNQFSKPKLLHFLRQQDEDKHLLSEINNLLKKGINPKDILVVSTSVTSIKSLVTLIKNSQDIPFVVIEETNKYWPSEHIGLCTLDFIVKYALSTPYLFISGLHLLMASEAQFHNQPEKEQSLIEKNSRKLAIAMMRAQKELTLLLIANEIPVEFISPEFEIKVISI